MEDTYSSGYADGYEEGIEEGERNSELEIARLKTEIEELRKELETAAAIAAFLYAAVPIKED